MSSRFSLTVIASGAEDWIGPEGVDERPAFLPAINEWLEARGMFGLVQIDETAPGNRAIGAYICGGQNREPLPDGFAEFFRSLPWCEPDKAVAVLLPEEGPTIIVRAA